MMVAQVGKKLGILVGSHLFQVNRALKTLEFHALAHNISVVSQILLAHQASDSEKVLRHVGGTFF